MLGWGDDIHLVPLTRFHRDESGLHAVDAAAGAVPLSLGFRGPRS